MAYATRIRLEGRSRDEGASEVRQNLHGRGAGGDEGARSPAEGEPAIFQSASKFKTRYAMFGFSDKANLDDGALWPTSYALKEVSAAGEKRIGELVKKAAS